MWLGFHICLFRTMELPPTLVIYLTIIRAFLFGLHSSAVRFAGGVFSSFTDLIFWQTWGPSGKVCTSSSYSYIKKFQDLISLNHQIIFLSKSQNEPLADSPSHPWSPRLSRHRGAMALLPHHRPLQIQQISRIQRPKTCPVWGGCP